MTTIYKVDDNTDKPIEQQVEKVGYPNLDADGETQYANTHFTDIDKAWTRLIQELEAGLSLSVRRAKEIREELRKIETMVVDYATRLESAKQNFEQYIKNR